MAFEIKVLGRVDLLIDGQTVTLGGSKQRAVLAMLALRANRTLSADELIDGLWGQRPPASAAKGVQLYVSRLRKAINADGSGARIVTRGRGYELRSPTTWWTRHGSSAWSRRPRSAGSRRGTERRGRCALELWRGAPLADVAEEPFASPRSAGSRSFTCERSS